MSILVLTSDTLIGTAATGNIEYNGQFFGTDSAASRAQIQRIVQSTVNAGGTNPFPASGGPVAVEYTNIPSWVKRITVMFSGVSTNGVSNMQVQIGSGSVAASGYLGASADGPSLTATLFTTGFGLRTQSAAAIVHGSLVINLVNSAFNYVASGNFARSDGATFITSAGSITLSGTLDRIRVTTVNGTDTFDAGSINLLLEG